MILDLCDYYQRYDDHYSYTDTKDSHTLHAPHTSRSASTDNIHRIHVKTAFFVSDNQRVSANIHNRPQPYPIPTAHTH